MVTKTPDELDGLTPDELKAHLADEEKTVFGRTVVNEPAFKKVKGVPQEMGLGSAGRETENHFRAIRKYEGPEAEKAARDAAAARKKKAA